MRSHIISNFFLDGAKIIFGSIVVGAFVQSAIVLELRLMTVGVGVALTIAFLLIANAFAEREV